MKLNIFFLCLPIFIILFCTDNFMKIKIKELNAENKRLEFKYESLKVFEKILSEFQSTECNSKFSKIYSWNESEYENLKIKFIPESDKINVFTFPEYFLKELEAEQIISINDIEKLNYEISKNPELTKYGYANINFFFQSRVANFLQFDLNKFNEEKLFNLNIKNQGDFLRTAGNDFEKLFPFVNAESMINVNFVDKKLLEKILFSKKFNIKNPGTKLSEILLLRESQEINSESLKNILRVSENDEINKFLGVKTWFWKIEINSLENEKLNFEAVICIIPETENLEKNRDIKIRILKIK